MSETGTSRDMRGEFMHSARNVTFVRNFGSSKNIKNMARKVTVDDLNEGFSQLVQLAEEGKCVIPGCGAQSELVAHLPTDPPILCYFHQNEGNYTHFGDYAQSQKNPYYNIWTCCDNSWFNSKCHQLMSKFGSRRTISTTERHKKNCADELERLKVQQEEQERYERMLNAGRDEYYDR